MRRLLRSPAWWATAAWTVLQGVYWHAALAVRPVATLDRCYWGSTPPGRLLPWPKPSGPFLAISPCRHVADHAVALLLTTGLWTVFFVLSALAVLGLGLFLEKRLRAG